MKAKQDRFFVFVLVPRNYSKQPEYFVMTYMQFMRLTEEQNQIVQEREKERGTPYAKFALGIAYSIVAKNDFRNAWGNLPE